MASVQQDPRPVRDHETGVWYSSANELEAARQRQEDHGALLAGIGIVAAVVIGMLVLLWLGGPRVEDQLPYPPSTTAHAPSDAWSTCDVLELRIMCSAPSGSKMDLVVADQAAMDNLCRALPCRQVVGITGNGNVKGGSIEKD